jgi:alkanesulfonate monooxygenase SsuD/methylene tetrahydromethanopterin reductase-like flavin-dependent oxidoreductase (luciferase family)
VSDDAGAADGADADLAVHLPVAAQPSLEALVSLGVRAERLGYRRAWLPETWGRDAVTTLSLLAERTDRIGIGSSLLPVYSRSPALLGQTAATLQEAADGRFRLGVGPSGPAVVENWHGVDFDRPLRRTRETVEVVRRVLAGETVTYDGDCFELDGFRLRCAPPSPPPPVDVGGMGPTAVELAGRFADGWHALMLSRAGLRDRLADLERGADLGGRSPDDVRVTTIVPCAVGGGDDDHEGGDAGHEGGDDDHEAGDAGHEEGDDHGGSGASDEAGNADHDGGSERARDLVARHVAFYVGGMGTFYRDALLEQGYDAAEAAHEAWRAGDRARAVDLLSGAVDDLAAWGSPSAARARLDRFRAVAGVDEVAVAFPRGADAADVARTMAALAPGD